MSERSYYPPNVKRVPEMDLMKALAIIAMVLIHVLETSSGLQIRGTAEKTVDYLINFLGCIPSGGVFMFAMGWGAAFSRRSTPKTYLDRMLQLVLLGLAVNFFEHYIPALFDPADFGPLSETAPSILAVDIYFFAPLAMLYFAGMKKLAAEGKAMAGWIFSALLTAVCFALNAALGWESMSTGNVWLDTLLGVFIRENDYPEIETFLTIHALVPKRMAPPLFTVGNTPT